ncbi:argininosuccinate synthase domain-containing protein [Thalassococcus sp. BH17M4-6]|uniref:argininosuccinate synthase domain-containing protein n=1 Tax=Thalassococcus sp. BH17M4-6 TaxID=3413148 RepID=UPI003BBC32CD
MSVNLSLRQLEGKKVGLLAGGGLSCWVVARVLKDQGVNVTVFCADVAQDEEPLLAGFLADMDRNEIPVTRIDLRSAAAEMAMDLARYDARYRGEYWNTTSALRMLLVRDLLPELQKAGCTVLAHGCVGGGNDERRFSNYTQQYAPNMAIFSPWRDLEMLSLLKSRQDMLEYIARTYPKGPLLEAKAMESVDGSLIGASFEGDWLEDLENPWTKTRFARSVNLCKGAETIHQIRLAFEGGTLVSLNGKRLSALDILTELNTRAGEAGVGRSSVIEDRISGAKMRGVYEAPALTVLGQAFRNARQFALSEKELDLFHSLSQHLGSEIYDGFGDSDGARAAKAAMGLLNARLDGTVSMTLTAGHALPVAFHAQEHASHVKHQRRFGQGGSSWN